MNPLIDMIATQANNSIPANNMLKQFAEFKKNWTPQTAQAKIDEMLRTGQINRVQYEQARQMAERFKGML